MRYFHGVAQSTYQRDIYFNRYRAAHQIYGFFLSHFPKPYIWSGSGRTLPHLVLESRRFSPAVLPAVLFRAEKKKPASFSIPDFSSRCPSPAVLQFFCKNSRHFWLALYLATEDVNLFWSCFLTFFLSVLYIAVLPDTASA